MRVLTEQFLPGTKKALHALQKRLFHKAGMGALWREDILRAKATYLFAKAGLKPAWMNSSLILRTANL